MQRGRIWLPQNARVIPLILVEFHSTPTGGHMGIMKTLAQVNENFVWENMMKDIRQYVTNYLTCQQTKYDHR